MLDEDDLLSRGAGDKPMHYYALDGSVIIGIKEDAANELPHKLPSIIAIIRGKKLISVVNKPVISVLFLC